MNWDQITRDDFPAAEDGYDRPSVDAHLEAVAALTGALEARIKALEVERDALRRKSVARSEPGPEHAGEAAVEVGSDASSANSREPVDAASTPVEQVPSATAQPAAMEEPVAAPDSIAGGGDEVSARVVATRLALEGAEREEIRKKLESSYELEDVDSVIDDVLERIG